MRPFQGSFLSDLCSSVAWFAQIIMVIVYNNTSGFNPNVALYVMEGIRSGAMASEVLTAAVP